MDTCTDVEMWGDGCLYTLGRFMETWMVCLSLICLVLTAFTCATFLVDTDRFRSVSFDHVSCQQMNFLPHFPADSFYSLHHLLFLFDWTRSFPGKSWRRHPRPISTTTPWIVGFIEQYTCYTISHKNVPSSFCTYLCQILTDFNSVFTGTLCGKFAIRWLKHDHTVAASLYDLVKYKCKIN